MHSGRQHAVALQPGEHTVQLKQASLKGEVGQRILGPSTAALAAAAGMAAAAAGGRAGGPASASAAAQRRRVLEQAHKGAHCSI